MKTLLARAEETLGKAKEELEDVSVSVQQTLDSLEDLEMKISSDLEREKRRYESSKSRSTFTFLAGLGLCGEGGKRSW